MPEKNNNSVTHTTPADREIVISRVFDAPVELVWNAWVDPKQVAQWWGPIGFTTTIQKMEVRPGGIWEHTMHGPDGADYPNKSQFVEVVKHERIVYTHGGGKEGGKGAHFTATWTFEPDGDKTTLTIRMVFDTAEDRNFVVKEYGAIEGGKQTLGRLAEKLAATPIVMERVFDAPIDEVWSAITDIEKLRTWYFPQLSGFKTEVGFEFDFTMEHEGKKFVHLCKVKEVVAGKKLAYSWRYAGYPGDSLLTFELSAEGSKTKLKFTHEGLETFVPEEHPEMARKNFVMGWTHFITKALPQFVEQK